MGNGTEIARIIKAELDLNAPSRTLDALIAEHIMRFSVSVMHTQAAHHFVCQREPGGLWWNVPFYSRDRGDALDLLKHLIPDYRGKPPDPGAPFYLVCISGQTGGADTFPLAVCKAALQAAGLYGNGKVYAKPN